MQVTFLAHSGFLVETEHTLLLFDRWTGTLPPLPEKPLLVFASHGHEDHFSPAVFALDDGRREVHFLLGSDISPSRVPPRSASGCTFLSGGEHSAPLPGVTVETLPSTDEGVAFLVSVDGKQIFHAGDLNWWHWEGEDPAWNRQMEADFKRFTQPLADRTIHLAMLPLDPRQETNGFRGAAHFLRTADIRRFLPMHQWENFAFTQKFLAACPEFAAQTVPVDAPGQVFTF